MIEYDTGGVNHFLGLFRLQGSVFPFAFLIATPISFVAFFVKFYGGTFFLGPIGGEFLTDNSVWSGFTVLVGFLIIFRTSEAYSRYWQGATSTYLMRAEWFDACSSLVAFCRHSKDANPQEMRKFRELLVRLFSVLHTCALAELEASRTEAIQSIDAFRYDCIDVLGLDDTSVRAIQDTPNKVELIFTWIQMVIVDAVADGLLTVPAPLLTRTFQELANGMVQFHDALKIHAIPFPFPYAQLCDGLLVLHGLLTPFVVSQWVTSAAACAIFCFVTVSTLWSLNAIAVEIENPFGRDDNDLEGDMLQTEMNNNLVLLAHDSTSIVPTLSIKSAPIRGWTGNEGEPRCLWDAWLLLGGNPRPSFRSETRAAAAQMSRQRRRKLLYETASRPIFESDTSVAARGESSARDADCVALARVSVAVEEAVFIKPNVMGERPEKTLADSAAGSLFEVPTDEMERHQVSTGILQSFTQPALVDCDPQLPRGYLAAAGQNSRLAGNPSQPLRDCCTGCLPKSGPSHLLVKNPAWHVESVQRKSNHYEAQGALDLSAGE